MAIKLKILVGMGFLSINTEAQLAIVIHLDVGVQHGDMLIRHPLSGELYGRVDDVEVLRKALY